MRRVALYTRVSTDLQVKEEGSLETQEHRLRLSLRSRPDTYTVVEAIRDQAVSGKNLDRPGVRRLLGLVGRKEVDLVMVTRIDRLSRSLGDFIELHEQFEANDVKFVSLNEQFDTTTAVGEAMLQIVLVFAQLERRQTAERTRDAVYARAQRGLFVGGRTPLGYERLTGGRLGLVRGEAELVTLIFEKYLAQRSSSKVADWLNEHGFRQRAHASRKRRLGRKDDTFTPNAVRQIVSNPIYIGKIVYQGALADQPVLYDGQHERLIDDDQWTRVQALLKANRVKLNGLPEPKAHEFLLTGLLRCSCGYALTTSSGTARNGTRHPYYRCTGLAKRSKHRCRVRQLRADALDGAILRRLRRAVQEPSLLREAAEAANRSVDEGVIPLRKRLEQLQRDHASAQLQAEAMLDKLLDLDAVHSKTAKRRLEESEARVRQIEQACGEVSNELAERERSRVDADRLLDGVRQFDAAWDGLSHAQRKELLSLMIHEIRVGPNHITVDFYDGWIAEEVTQAIDPTERPPDPGVDRQGEGFADEMVWLRSTDSNRGPSG